MVCVFNKDAADWRTILGGVKNPLIVTDPPFNIGYHYTGYADNLDDSVYWDMLLSVFGDCPLVLIHYPEQLHKFTLLSNRVPDKVVTWCYNSNTLKQHRDIGFYGVTPDFNRVKQPYKNPNDKRIKQRIENGSPGARLYDWWNINQVKNVSKEKKAHPCQMPIEVMANTLGIIPGDYTIIDPFCGTGTTLIAALMCGFTSVFGFDLSAEYCDIAKHRVNEYIELEIRG